MARLLERGLPVKLACRLLEVSHSGFYEWRSRPASPAALRREWLTGVITEIHARSRGTYGAPRVHAELRLGMGIMVSRKTVAKLMRAAGLAGIPRRQTRKNRCAVLDAFSRKIVGWSIDNSQNTTLVVNALDMAVDNRNPKPGAVFHSDHGVQFTSWTFTNRVKEAGLMPSLGTVGDGYDNAMMESFWSKMQTELLDRKKWKTRTELANEIFQYLEIFHNRQRRHSKLGYLTPVEYERLHELQQPA
ncbi:transposase-like protein [Amycolatopsis taiwanensis]|uniref:Transposase-like protein n=1 Tax=Amycolatopsis taiwanensis TaxID=342230 RepID=A0A9W6RBA1_9PSEU|nr:transposase-like protein [Amycolatopsis taiwanensis]